VGELRYAVGGAFDSRLFHSVSARRRYGPKEDRTVVPSGSPTPRARIHFDTAGRVPRKQAAKSNSRLILNFSILCRSVFGCMQESSPCSCRASVA